MVNPGNAGRPFGLFRSNAATLWRQSLRALALGGALAVALCNPAAGAGTAKAPPATAVAASAAATAAAHALFAPVGRGLARPVRDRGQLELPHRERRGHRVDDGVGREAERRDAGEPERRDPDQPPARRASGRRADRGLAGAIG